MSWFSVLDMIDSWQFQVFQPTHLHWHIPWLNTASCLSRSPQITSLVGKERDDHKSKHAKDYSHQIWILKEHISLKSFTLTLWSIKQQAIMLITRGKWHFIGWSFFFCYVLLDNPPQNRIGPKSCISRVLQVLYDIFCRPKLETSCKLFFQGKCF